MHRWKLIPIIVVCLVAGACGQVPVEGSGGVASPPDGWVSDSAAAAVPSPVTTPEPAKPSHAATTHPRAARARPPSVPHHRAAPKAPDHPALATALCRDGTYSYAAHHQGACSHHHGVARFYR